VSYISERSFSLLAQRKRTKRKGSQSFGPPGADFPALLETTGSLKTRPLWRTQTGSNSFSVFSVVLGGMKWQKQKTYLIFFRGSITLPISNFYMLLIFNIHSSFFILKSSI